MRQGRRRIDGASTDRSDGRGHLTWTRLPEGQVIVRALVTVGRRPRLRLGRGCCRWTTGDRLQLAAVRSAHFFVTGFAYCGAPAWWHHQCQRPGCRPAGATSGDHTQGADPPERKRPTAPRSGSQPWRSGASGPISLPAASCRSQSSCSRYTNGMAARCRAATALAGHGRTEMLLSWLTDSFACW
jgi:hypothetical protein